MLAACIRKQKNAAHRLAAQGVGSHMKVILALAAVATATTDVFLASDRMAASAAVLNSVCDNSQPTALRLHLLAPTKEAAQTLATATEIACDGAVVLPYGLAEFETLVRTRVGEEPMWTTALSKVERSKSTYAVPVAPWDRDEKHTSPYNHARFYARDARRRRHRPRRRHDLDHTK